MLSAGKLRHRITIQRYQEERDAAGAVIKNWVDWFTNVPASVEYLSAREFVSAQANHSNVTARIVIRWRPGLNATMRILHRDKIYNIAGVLPDLDSGMEYITLPVSEGVNEG